MQISHNNHLAPIFFVQILPNLPILPGMSLWSRTKSIYTVQGQTQDAFFSSTTIPETPLQHSDGFQLVTNRKRRRQILQTLAAADNEPVPYDNDVFSDSDGK